jgi:hypothetical protein
MSEHDEWPSDDTITIIVEIDVPRGLGLDPDQVIDGVQRALGAERAYEDNRWANLASFYISAKNLMSGSLLA